MSTVFREVWFFIRSNTPRRDCNLRNARVDTNVKGSIGNNGT